MAFPAPTAASVTPDLTQNIGQTLIILEVIGWVAALNRRDVD
jgi:hypothetical protein